MRNGTAYLLIAVILLFAIFGWRALGWIALVITALFVAILLAGVFLVWTARRRMRRALAQMKAMLEQNSAPPAGRTNPNVIDVEATQVREDRPADRQP